MERNHHETVCAIALNRIFGYEPKLSHELIDNLGSAEAVFELSDKEKDALFGPYSSYSGRICREELDLAEAEFEAVTAAGADFISSCDDEYPGALRQCEDAPAGLYCRCAGTECLPWNSRTAVAVVGTRNMSSYGKDCCRAIVESMARSEARPIIVSGLAIGIDITAHLTALECGLPTVAVLPTGIDSIYPARHRAIAERIASTPGCALVSDYPTGTAPVALNFLRRNRIIAGMGASTVLVESRVRGGGMMTARLAAGYGREVFAVPGRMEDYASGGCNLLIHEKIAEPLISIDGVCRDLGLGRFTGSTGSGRTRDVAELVRAEFSGSMSTDEVGKLIALADAVRRNRGIALDSLCNLMGLGYGETAQLAGTLEAAGFLEIDLLQCCSIRRDKLR